VPTREQAAPRVSAELLDLFDDGGQARLSAAAKRVQELFAVKTMNTDGSGDGGDWRWRADAFDEVATTIPKR